MTGARILVLGGTSEGRELAGALGAAGFAPVTSLAGRTRGAAQRAGGPARTGGFGGLDGLVAWLTDAGTAPRAIVDASHPYAARMSLHAAAAAATTGIPLLRLDRPGWVSRHDAPGWQWVDDHESAAMAAARLGGRPFLAIGRQRLPAYAGPLGSLPVLARVTELHDDLAELPPSWRVIATRGPFALAGELALFDAHRIDVLVTKDSGGADTAAKLDAAAARRVPVIVVRRPPAPPGVPAVADVAGALSWCARFR